MNIQFKEITELDLPFIKDIYDYYILNTTATYYTEQIELSELKEFIFIGHNKYKSYLILIDDNQCGFCYLTQFKKRQAYNRTAEISLYLKSQYTGLKIGIEAVNFLEKIAKTNNISVLLGIISGDNQYSIKLIEKCGFEKCGHLKKVGEKFNKVLDVVYYQKNI
jgi:phosphinothricin acetyltransferase